MNSAGKPQLILNSARWRFQRRFDAQRKREVSAVRRLGEQLSIAAHDEIANSPEGPVAGYSPSAQVQANGHVDLVWFDQSPNYGDLLSPWLLGLITGLPVRFADRRESHVVMIGSIVSAARSSSMVWGTGSYGTERRGVFNPDATYHAVRGPLTRSRLLNVGIDCPRIYGDPALLLPFFYQPDVEKKYDVGVVVRHTEDKWRRASAPPGVRIIDLRTRDVEGTTRAILECRSIVSSSLHGLIVADAYGIPNAWLDSDSGGGGSRPFGGEFKFYDYFASVNKLRHAQSLDLTEGCPDADTLMSQLHFDDTPIDFDPIPLLDRCPVLIRD